MINLKIYSLENQDWFKSHKWKEASSGIYRGQHLKCKECDCTVVIVGTWERKGKEVLYFINASDGDLSCTQVIEKKNNVIEAPVEEAKMEQKKQKLIEIFKDANEDVCEHDPQEEDYSTMWGISAHFLTKENLEALQQGKIISINDGEYVHYLKLKS